ncbi:MAG: metallophosphoesterase [Lachnospiraceae bacterium]|nr:metallophosphoesterase [Lachnospiraceae bacterium]
MKNLNFRLISAGLLVLVILCLAAIFHLFGGFGRISAYLEKRQQAAEDKHLSVEEVTLTVPGLNRDYTFLYIADTHVVTSSDTDTSDINTYAASRLPMFVNGEGMTSARQFSGWIDMANAESVEALLMGGDIIDCPSDSNLNFLAGQLAALKVPYLYTLGNHDWTLPWAYLDDHAKGYYRPLFAPYMDGNTSFHVMRLDGLTIAAIDNSSDQVDPAVLEPLAALLSEGTPVIILLHVPLYTEDLAAKATEAWGHPIVLGEGGITPNEASAAFLEMIYEETSPVVAVLSGHVHFGARTTLPNGIPQYVADGGYKGKGLIIHVTSGS